MENTDKLGRLQLDLLNEYIKANRSMTYAEKMALDRIIKYDSGFNELQIRMISIKKLGKDSSSLKACVLRFGEAEGGKRFKEKCKKCSHTVNDYINKYGETEGRIKYKKDRAGVGLRFMIERYGKIEGKIKWEDYLHKWKKSHSIDGYIEKFGEVTGKQKYEEKITKYKKNNSLDGFIKKYGEKNGKKIWFDKQEKRASKSTKEYMIATYGKDTAEYFRAFNKRFQNMSLPNFRKRYGEIEGKIRYDDCCKIISYKNSLEYLYETYGKEKGDIIREERRLKMLNTMSNNGLFPQRRYSIVSQDLFWLINEKITNTNRIRFATKNKEFYIYDKESKKVYSYDFRYENKIIEFQGDYYHCNPLIYSSDFYNTKKKLIASKIWEADQIKNDCAKKNGFDVMVVWQYDFIKNPQNILDECLTFLNK